MTSNIDENWTQEVINYTKPPTLDEVIDKQIQDLKAIKERIKTVGNEDTSLLDIVKNTSGFFAQVNYNDGTSERLVDFKDTANGKSKSLMFCKPKNDGIRVFINNNSIVVMLDKY